MKKCAVLFLLVSFLFTGCSANNGGDIIILDDSNNNNGQSNNDNNENVVLRVQTICFADENLDVDDYLGLESGTQKRFDKMDGIDFIYERISTAKANNQISFIDGENLKEKDIDFNKQEVVIYTTVHDWEASYFTIDKSNVKGDKINVTLRNLVEVSFSSIYSTVGLIYAIVPKNKRVEIDISYIQDEESNIVKKPIVYFYPENEMDLSINYVNEDKLLTTYPKYNNGWDIRLNKNGTFVTDASNREYYALYFDELPNYKCSFGEGFYVNKDNAINFLEEKMDFIGYTNREVDEFMMYWLPILESNKHSLVYFEQTEERNEECPLIFSTNPDTLIRTIIHIKKVDGEVNIPEQQLKHYDRKGFVVTEWGGAEY